MRQDHAKEEAGMGQLDELAGLTGKIAVQIHGGANTEVRYRNITIQTLGAK